MSLTTRKATLFGKHVPAFVQGDFLGLLNKLVNRCAAAPAFTVGAEASNAIAVTIQLKDADGNNLAQQKAVDLWISSSDLGVPASTAPDGTVSVSTGILLKTHTTKVLHRVVCDANGQIVISIGESTAKDFYVCVAIGEIVASQIISFA